MAANDLAGNPLFDTEDNDDDDRRLATTSYMPKAKREAGGKKKAGGGARLFGSGAGGVQLAGGKMFGKFDVGAMVGEDEIEINGYRGEVEVMGKIDESEFVVDALGEKRKKEMVWNSSPVVKQRVNHEKKSIEKHEEMMIKQGETKFLNGILNQALVFDDKNDIEIVITNENKTAHHNHSQTNGTQQIASRYTSNFFSTTMEANGASSLTETQYNRQFSTTQTGGALQKPQFSQSLLNLKRSTNLEDIPIRDRNDLKKILTKSVIDRRRLATAEEVIRSSRVTDFKASDINDDDSSKSMAGNPMDEEKTGGRLMMSDMVAMEEGEEGELGEEGGLGEEGSYLEEEEGYDEVRKEIERVEQLVMSDEEEGSEGRESGTGPGKGVQEGRDRREGGEGAADSDEDEDDSNYLDDEADEVDDDEASGSQSRRESHEEDENSKEAVECEDSQPQEPAMRRLKKAKDVKAAKKAEKRQRREERRAQYFENEKKRRKMLKNNDIYDEEADLGEIVDGKDAGLKNIDRENPEENDDDVSSANLEELIGDIEEFDGENESLAFRHHINDMINDDKELLKRVVKGSFKESIMIRTGEDRKQTEEFRRKRLEFIKKKVDEINKFQSAFRTKEDKYKRLLGVDQEELEAEINQLENSLQKNEKSDDKKIIEKRENTDEKNRKKNILNRLKISDVSNTSHNNQRKLFFDSSISKNEHLMKTLDNFDVNKKTQLPTNQIFVFRKKKQQSD